MDLYRKTVFIEAYHYPFADDVPDYFKDAIIDQGNGVMYIMTLEGDSYVADDCWIARGLTGEFWRIDNDVFSQTYEKVNNAH